MHFMSDVYVECDVCQGRRYNRETMAVRYKEKSIADVLEMSVEEALAFFQNHSAIRRKLETLHRVGQWGLGRSPEERVQRSALPSG
jgi:excinuclease ABC subunit A